ncbi:hypothetical protein HMPREF1988_00041, partial [Porphyromonas gingivalis F0185]
IRQSPCKGLFLHFWSDSYKNKPQTTFRAAVWGSMFMLGFLQSQEDSLSSFLLVEPYL